MGTSTWVRFRGVGAGLFYNDVVPVEIQQRSVNPIRETRIMDSFFIETHQRSEFIDITEAVRQSLARQGMQKGIGVVYVPHTTAGITINEGYDPDVVTDMLGWFDRMIPKEQEGFRHTEGDSDAHVKASLVGSSVTLAVEAGEVVLGRWQKIFLCEFDGPRQRTVQIQWVERVSVPSA